MTEKKLYDMRGRQANIARLAHFHVEGFIHMLFYRILTFLAVIYGIVLLAFFAYPQLSLTVKALTVLVWIFFTPQLYETAKGFTIISTKGLAFGHLSEEYRFLMKSKYGKSGGIYHAVPYAVLAVWAAGFVAVLLWWSI
ncbi:MAG: hypothetical protein LVQ95_04285 [Candidatus Micrarchaeales archaeon]|nr:hypothetical protein [Candidatus Micrarchaeales archaeon]